MEKSNVKWFTTNDFLGLEPINVFGKENGLNVPESEIQNYHCLCRSEYKYDSESSVLMKITADDYYKLYINGAYITEGPAPSYHSSRFYNEFDITPYLHNGKNTIAAHIYYQGLINRVYQSGDNRFGIACLVNGENLIWKYKKCDAFSGHKLGYDTAFSESFDSRKYNANWKNESYDDSLWSVMKEKEHDYTFCPQPTQQLSTNTIKPISQDKNVYDFGTEIVGCLKIKAKGKENDKIIIRCGEELNADGSVRYSDVTDPVVFISQCSWIFACRIRNLFVTLWGRGFFKVRSSIHIIKSFLNSAVLQLLAGWSGISVRI